MAASSGVSAAQLPRLLYVGDVSVADTMAGEALLFRLLQFYPADRLAIICGVRPGMPMLPGVAYHHWGPMFPRLLYSRVASEYILWRAWRYYQVPAAITRIATMFKPDAILTISHVSGWLAAWQLSLQRRIPLHLMAHDDFVYASRFPVWSQPWAERQFGHAYRAAQLRFCISDSMEAIYRARFGAAGSVIYPTFKVAADAAAVNVRDTPTLTFAYGGSLNTSAEVDQIVVFAREAFALGHRLIAFTPQHDVLAGRAAASGVTLDARAPIPSDELRSLLRDTADCLLLPQSLDPAQQPWVSTAFPSKWADYATLGLPVLVWATAESSSARFVHEHPGCAELVTGTDAPLVAAAIARLANSAAYRRSLAEILSRVGADLFSPQAAWTRFSAAIAAGRQGAAA